MPLQPVSPEFLHVIKEFHLVHIFNLASGVLPSVFRCFDDPGREIGIVLIGSQHPNPVIVFGEVESERLVGLGAAKPNKFITPPLEAGMKMLLVETTYEAVNAIGTNNQVRTIK